VGAFAEREDGFGKIAAALCLVRAGRADEWREMLERVRAKAPFWGLAIDKMLFRCAGEGVYQSRFSQKDPHVCFLEALQRNDRVAAARVCIKRVPAEPRAIEIVVREGLVSGSLEEITDALVTKARTLVEMKPSQRAMALLAVALVRARMWVEAKRNLQILCIMAPAVIPIAKPILVELVRLTT
jgi:hypothetical protein